MDKGKIKRDKKRSFYLLLMAVCVVVFAFSVYRIGSKLYGYYIDNKRYTEIRNDVKSIDHSEAFEQIFSQTHTETASEAEVETKEPKPDVKPIVPVLYDTVNGDPNELGDRGILKEYEELKQINNDLVGWIKMPGFEKPIDYPILQAEDNDYYLYRDFYKNTSYAGSVFLDHRSHAIFPDRHLILYAHAMNDRSMFGNLKEFSEKPELYMANDIIYIDLLSYRMEYKVFSVYYEDEKYNYRQVVFGSDLSYEIFLQKIRGNSVHDFDVFLNHNDRILTLSTCNNTLGKNIRSIVHAKLMRVIDYNRSVLPNEQIQSRKTEQKVVVSANVYLSKLEILQKTEEESSRIELTPRFASVFGEYTAYVAGDDQKIIIDVKSSDPQADIIIKVDGIKYEDGFVFSEEKALISIEVISRDGQYSRVHYVTLIKVIEEEEEEKETTTDDI